MKTKQWVVDKNDEQIVSNPQVHEAAEQLKNGEVVAFPTETVYGLGANACSDEAIEKIYQAKGRPSDNPLIVHISSMEQLEEIVAEIPATAQKLITAFWPGPLTIIFKKKAGKISEKVTAGLDTVAVRMPSNVVARALIAATRLPIAAPSANQSGKPSPTKAAHVFHDLHGKIAGVVDGGDAGVGVESTVIDCTQKIPIILRPGGVSAEAIEKNVGHVKMDVALKDQNEQPMSPGMKYTHYAPQAPVYLVDGDSQWIQARINEKRSEGLKVGLLTTAESVDKYQADLVLACGTKTNLSTVAENLFHTLRLFDEQPLDLIFSETFPEEEIGVAIMNRLKKAAGQRIIQQNK